MQLAPAGATALQVPTAPDVPPHTQVQRAKAGYLEQLRAQGDYSDPFAKARRREDYSLSRAEQQARPAMLAAAPAAAPAAGTAGAAGALMPAGGGAFAAPAASPLGAPNSFGSPFPGTTPGAWGGAMQNAGSGSLSRSASKPGGRSAKKR